MNAPHPLWRRRVLGPAPGRQDQTGHRTWAPAFNKSPPTPRREEEMPRGPAPCPQSRGCLPVGYAPIWPGRVPEARRGTPGVRAPSVTEQVCDYGENRQLAATRCWHPSSVWNNSHVSTPLQATPHTASLPPVPRSPARTDGVCASFCAAANAPRLGGVCRKHEHATSLFRSLKGVSPAKSKVSAGPAPSEAPGENVFPAFSSF